MTDTNTKDHGGAEQVFPETYSNTAEQQRRVDQAQRDANVGDRDAQPGRAPGKG